MVVHIFDSDECGPSETVLKVIVPHLNTITELCLLWGSIEIVLSVSVINFKDFVWLVLLLHDCPMTDITYQRHVQSCL